MNKSLGLVCRAVVIGLTAALVAAPAALAAEPAPGNPPTACDKTTTDQVITFLKRANEVESDVEKAADAAGKAQTKPQAEQAKATALKAKDAAGTLEQDVQSYLKKDPEIPTDDRVCATQQLSRSQKAIKAADAAIAVAQAKLDKPDEPKAKAQITVFPESVGRGEIIGVAVFCVDAKVSGFASDAIDFVPESQYSEQNVTAIGGLVKKDASVGSHTATAACGDEKLTATFTVTNSAPVQAKKPTTDDVRRKAVIKPKGKIETGGGATALVTV